MPPFPQSILLDCGNGLRGLAQFHWNLIAPAAASICMKHATSLTTSTLYISHFRQKTDHLCLTDSIMSPPRGAAMNSSPHSFDDATNHGTPSTNLTAFTPEAASGIKERVLYSAPRPVLKLRSTKPKHARYVFQSPFFYRTSLPISKLCIHTNFASVSATSLKMMSS